MNAVDSTTGEILGTAHTSLAAGTVSPAYLIVLGGVRTWIKLEESEIAEFEEMGETVKTVRVS